ncbi:MAG: M1 family metallopeptidase [Isosphaeraceae bacterium]
MMRSMWTGRVASAASRGATALSCLAFFVAATLATAQQAARNTEAARQLDRPQAKTGGEARGKTNATTKRARVTDLRGDYDWHRANNDLLYYHLDIRVDPEKRSFGGKNTIKFRMLRNDCRIHLDLDRRLTIDKILLGETPLRYERDARAVFVEFPEILRQGEVYSIDFYYSGRASAAGRFGGITFGRDPQGRPWITTSCEGPGASVWWPNKDQWRDEVESMDLSVTIPSDLVDASNGRLVAKKDLGDGWTRYDWHVSYPINNYCVSVNIGKYAHFEDRLGGLTLDFYCLPENIEKAKKQFAQAKGMLEAFQHYFGEYPFVRDGYKLIEVPYAGMEHQSAVTYGNRYSNGYLERDWTGVGISLLFDFIIIHESGHEWFGNSVSAADRSDMWIQEGWTTYLECLYVEYHHGKADGLKYTNAYKKKVRNRQPIIGERGTAASPDNDQYFKGALFLNTLRSVVDDDRRWWQILHAMHDTFKYRNIMTEDVVRFFNEQTGKELTAIFDEYLRRAEIPVLELKFDEAKGTVSYRWRAQEKGFAMPVKVGTPNKWELIRPTTEWATMKNPLGKEKFEVATDLYYIAVERR